MEAWRKELYLQHGGVWKNHKYIRKEGDRYIYPSDLDSDSSLDLNNEVDRNVIRGKRTGIFGNKYEYDLEGDAALYENDPGMIKVEDVDMDTWAEEHGLMKYPGLRAYCTPEQYNGTGYIDLIEEEELQNLIEFDVHDKNVKRKLDIYRARNRAEEEDKERRKQEVKETIDTITGAPKKLVDAGKNIVDGLLKRKK